MMHKMGYQNDELNYENDAQNQNDELNYENDAQNGVSE